MSRSKIHYLRVTEKEVIPVEIQSVGSSSDPVSAWLKDRHIQEILQLLQGTIESYIALKGNKQNCIKQQDKPSDIVTGNSVRFGYMFKSRPSGQTCLIEETSDSCSLKSFHVLKDKVVVLAHPLEPGSPNKMSQLMKVLNGKRQSTGQGVSISSYFKKIPSQTVSQKNSDSQSNTQELSVSQSISNSQNSQDDGAKENQSDSGLPVVAPSEGPRNKIKNIVKRGEIGLARKHRRKHLNQPDQQLRQDAENERDEASRTDKNMTSRVCQQDLENTFSKKEKFIKKNHVKNTDADGGRASSGIESGKCEKSSIKSVNNEAITSKQYPPFKDGSNESFMIGDVQVSLVENPCIEIDCDEKKGIEPNSISLISVKQVNDIEREKTQRQSNEDEISNNQTDSEDEILGNLSDAQSHSSNEMLALPSASFLMKGAKRKSSAMDMKMLKNYLKSYDADVDTDSVKDSPKFGKKQSERETVKANSDYCSDEDTSIEDKINQNKASNSKDSDSEATHKTIHKHKFKRKFPKFSSDSDSDTNLPAKKAKTNSEKANFVNLENMKGNSKKVQISKSFFSTDRNKAQPTLSFFMSDKKGRSQNVKSSAKNKSSEDFIDVDAEDDVPVIEHIDFPKVKSELDFDLMNEIRSISSIQMLNEEHLQYLIRSNEKYLRGIFEGKTPCERHQEFKKGGKSRRDLNHSSRLCQYSEEQVDTVMESLMAMFCKRHHKYLDYIMKVLLPEILIKIHMDVHGTSHADSEKIIATQSSVGQ